MHVCRRISIIFKPLSIFVHCLGPTCLPHSHALFFIYKDETGLCEDGAYLIWLECLQAVIEFLQFFSLLNFMLHLSHWVQHCWAPDTLLKSVFSKRPLCLACLWMSHFYEQKLLHAFSFLLHHSMAKLISMDGGQKKKERVQWVDKHSAEVNLFSSDLQFCIFTWMLNSQREWCPLVQEHSCLIHKSSEFRYSKQSFAVFFDQL